MKLHDANKQVYKKTFSHILLHMYFALIFWERITITSSKRVLKVCEHNFFQ